MIPTPLEERLQAKLEERQQKGLLRTLSAWEADPAWINLADNDYLGLARDPVLIAAAREAASRHGCSSSASPLVSGYQQPHLTLENELLQWHGFPSGLIWNSGYAANHSILAHLPQPGDLIFADRLIHHSMISGILQSGARLIRHHHNDIEHLHSLLREHRPSRGISFVVTESVFSMDGDSPDLAALVRLKEEFPFCLMVDEAHATGWYGPEGSGRVNELGVTPGIDILVGTLGKSLGSQGAYTLFRHPALREYLINHAGDFIYSTYLSPIAACTARTAIDRVRQLSGEQGSWHQASRDFRDTLRDHGWEVPAGDSPIVPVLVGDGSAVLSLAAFLRSHHILVGAIRPPTVPAGTSRLRMSLNRSFNSTTAHQVTALLDTWRAAHPS
jgi:8-amino-7-oxononanoate synthase